ncbi:hypothetical protein BX666DRAFT_740299 [Dichotomocladium elegans]|nr:hypothetical protein BX666DRAFT_740299 [Dichotomocladium elegans]
MPSLDQEDLREFHMGGLSDYTGEAIVPFLQAHQTTLRVVRIAVDASDGNRLERWSTITPLTFPVLHTLHLANMNALSPHMTSLIYRTPVLRDVVLKRIHSIRDMFLEATLQRQERLSRLTILDCPNLANNAIDRFFVKIKSRLRHVVLDTGYGLALPTLLSLAATHGETLKHVELNGDSFRGSDAGLLPFVEMLQPYGVLQHLTVGYSDALTPDTVHALADHPNLRSVAFIECHRLTDDAVRLLVDKSTSLKTIRVAHCRAVSRLTIHYARGVLGRDAVRDT